MKLRKVTAGYYQTPDGRYTVHGFYMTAAEAGGYGAGMRWYWLDHVSGEGGQDHYATKRDAVDALEEWIEEQP